MSMCSSLFSFFSFHDPAPTEIYTLSLHDALPISAMRPGEPMSELFSAWIAPLTPNWLLAPIGRDRKSTRLNSSHLVISYAVFCLKKKKKQKRQNASYDKSQMHEVHIHLQ